MIVNLRASILSPISPQIRFIVKGENGSYVKYGLDPQEDYLKVGKKSRSDGYGVEPESSYGKIQLVKEIGAEAMLAPEPYAEVKALN